MTTTTLSLADWPARGQELFPGVSACAVAATAATFLSQHYGAPVPALNDRLNLDAAMSQAFDAATAVCQTARHRNAAPRGHA